jgi:histidine triad (HIT) family protein
VPSIFTRIMDGELPARFVWQDERCVAFLSIAPIMPGHTLVVPRQEVAHWIDLDAETWAHVSGVAQRIGTGIEQVWKPEKVGLMLAGLEVPHVHLHVLPVWSVDDLSFAKADADAPPEDLDANAERIREALRELGAAQVAE